MIRIDLPNGMSLICTFRVAGLLCIRLLEMTGTVDSYSILLSLMLSNMSS